MHMPMTLSEGSKIDRFLAHFSENGQNNQILAACQWCIDALSTCTNGA